MNDIIDTWNINNNINHFLIEAINEEYFKDVSASKGRTVGEQFAHVHNVRLMWLGAAMPELLVNVQKIEKAGITKQLITAQYTFSARAIAQLLQNGLNTGKIKNFKPHPAAFLGYMIAHEAHHRGQIILTLKQSGHAPDKKILYGMWEWGARSAG